MPQKPPHPCNRPGCPKLTTARFCEAHAQYHEQQRGSASSRGFDHEWRTRTRPRILARDPFCRKCKRKPSTQVHHVIARARGGSDDDENLEGWCRPCHDALGGKGSSVSLSKFPG